MMDDLEKSEMLSEAWGHSTFSYPKRLSYLTLTLSIVLSVAFYAGTADVPQDSRWVRFAMQLIPLCVFFQGILFYIFKLDVSESSIFSRGFRKIEVSFTSIIKAEVITFRGKTLQLTVDDGRIINIDGMLKDFDLMLKLLKIKLGRRFI